MVKKKINRATVILTSLLLCLIMLFGAGASIMKVYAADNSNYDTDKVLYLSDTSRITHDKASFSLGNSRLWMAPSQKNNIPNKAAQAKIEGAWYTFEYGVYAHANSVVYFDISKFSDKYKYFSAYVGLCNGASKSDGVLVRVDFSKDGTNWTADPEGKTPAPKDATGTQFVGYNQDFLHITYDVTGVKWIRLFANKNGSDAADQVIWTDAKLTTTVDEGESVKSLAAYDAEIKAKVGNVNWNTIGSDKTKDLFQDKELEKLILQREFVSRVGQYALKKFIGESPDNKAMLNDWLLNDLDVLREFMLGGAPFKGNYYNSLNVLSNLYKSYKKDLSDTTLLSGDGKPESGNKYMPKRTFGELCRTMMFSVALTHDGSIGSYLQGSVTENKSDPYRRYAIFKYMYQTERFVITRNADGTWKSETMNMFGSLKVEEMRWLMCAIIDDESILWLNDHVQTRINAKPGSAGSLLTPHPYVKYTDPNYNNPVFYDDANYDYFNNQFAVDAKDDNHAADYEFLTASGKNRVGLWDAEYHVPAGEGEPDYVIHVSRKSKETAKLQKVWMNFSNKFGTGSVCGGISKSGVNIRTSRGIPANVIGQPGHAAILYFSKDANGKGSWKIDNDVGGWLAATKGERHLLGWGNAAWQRNSGGTVVYFHLAQLCLDDYDNLVRAEEYCWLAKAYQGDLAKQEALYEKALTTQILNLDAWYGLVTTYKANTAKKAADYSTLAGRIGDTLWNHPTALHCLFRLFTDTEVTKIPEVQATLSDPVFTTQLRTIEVNALAKAKASGSTAAKSKVNYLMGLSDKSVADFSFDGDNAGCIVWADAYNDGTFTWYYSIDGKQSWQKVTFNEGDSHAYKLSEKELTAISPENDIYVYIEGTQESNAYKIEVAAKAALPDTLYANDWENRVMGVDATYEWRYLTLTEDDDYEAISNWRCYADASPDCTGDKIIEVRLKGTNKNPASDGRIFTFTDDKNTPERSYISVNYLSVDAFSTESQDAKRPYYAANAIDGNAKTYWHTDYAKSIKGSATRDENGNVKYSPAPYLTIKLDVPRYISALEFSQRQYDSAYSIFAKKAYVYVSEDGENWKEAGKREDLLNAEDLNAIHFDEPVYGQYVKLEFTELYETNTRDGVFTTVSLINIYEDTTKKTAPNGEAMKDLSEITPNKDISAGFGAIIKEEEVAGEEIVADKEFIFESGYVPPKKSNPAAWIALPIVLVVLAGAGVAVFFVIKRKKAAMGTAGNAVVDEPKPKKSASKAPAQKAAKPAEKPAAPTTTQSATAKPAAKPAATAEAKPAATAPKASTTTPAKASTTTPAKASTTLPKASTTTPAKTSTTLPKASTTTPTKSSTTPTKVSTTNPKASTVKPKK